VGLFSGQFDGGSRNFPAEPDAMPVHIVKCGTDGNGGTFLFGANQNSD